MLEVASLNSGYGKVPILRDVSFRLGRAESVGLLGRNGVGKTTLLKALMGELPCWSGDIVKSEIRLSGAATRDRARAGLGYVPQGKQIFPFLTVAENLRVGCIKNYARADEMIREVLGLFPRLERLLERQGGSLSGGEQQLLALARCLCGQPDIILLDEPTEGIQPSICDEIIDVLTVLKTESGVALIVVEQDIEFLWSLCDRVMVMDKGHVIDEIDPKGDQSREKAKKFLGIEG